MTISHYKSRVEVGSISPDPISSMKKANVVPQILPSNVHRIKDDVNLLVSPDGRGILITRYNPFTQNEEFGLTLDTDRIESSFIRIDVTNPVFALGEAEYGKYTLTDVFVYSPGPSPKE